MKYEHVDMDSCFLSEKPKPAVQPSDTAILPELQALPVPLRPLTNTKKVCIAAKFYSCLFCPFFVENYQITDLCIFASSVVWNSSMDVCLKLLFPIGKQILTFVVACWPFGMEM